LKRSWRDLIEKEDDRKNEMEDEMREDKRFNEEIKDIM
jgi:hypothetical protein